MVQIVCFSYQIMKQCWRYDVNGRPSFQSLVEQLDKCIQEGKNLVCLNFKITVTIRPTKHLSLYDN